MMLSLVAIATFAATADEAATITQPGKTCTGLVKAVDAKKRTVTVRRFLGSRQFNLG
jgi:hypothetical protein